MHMLLVSTTPKDNIAGIRSRMMGDVDGNGRSYGIWMRCGERGVALAR